VEIIPVGVWCGVVGIIELNSIVEGSYVVRSGIRIWGDEGAPLYLLCEALDSRLLNSTKFTGLVALSSR
jgi:hypothetical protein